MKKQILTLAIITLPILTLAQTKEKDLTQAEQFSAQAGTLIKRQFLDIGTIKGIEVKVLKYKDLNSGSGKSALSKNIDNN